MLKGEDEAGYVHEQVFAEYYNAWTHGDAYGTMLRTDREKIVVYHGVSQRLPTPNFVMRVQSTGHLLVGHLLGFTW